MNYKLIGLVVALLLVSVAIARADTATFDKKMLPVLAQYLKIPKALAADKTIGVKQAANRIVKLSENLDATAVKGEHAAHYKGLPGKIKAAARMLADAKDIAAMREVLKELSKPMSMWATMSEPKGISVMYCSMAPGAWLQQDDTTIANPYYGAKMLRCGEIVSGKGAGEASGHMKGHGH